MKFKKIIFISGIVIAGPLPLSINAQNLSENLQTADSFYLAGNWPKAAVLYRKSLQDTSTNGLAMARLGISLYKQHRYEEALVSFSRASENNPPPGIRPQVYANMAKIYAYKHNSGRSYEYLDEALKNGYLNFNELDTSKDFAGIKHEVQFRQRRQRAFGNAFPCSVDPKARQFDFWIGEWKVYQTGTSKFAGHSIIESASGGCMILENWTSANAPYNGKSMNFIDNGTGKWQQVWVGSEGSGQQVFSDGEYRDSAMHFVFQQKDAQGNMLNGRFAFYNQGPAQVRQLNETSSDGGVTWNTVYDFTYKRIIKK